MKTAPTPARARTLSRARLWVEFAVLFGGVPVAMAVFFGHYPLFPVILSLAVLALVLLAQTPDFSPRDLLLGPVAGQWKLIAAFALAGAALCFGLTLALVPERLLELPRHRTGLWLLILLAYPLLSAAPQELIYRVLFFRRYGALFPSDKLALAANAVAFGFAHLFYMNPLTIGLTTVAGLIFGAVYLRFGSVLLTTVLHGLAGQLVFTSGLGIYFYHGAVGQMP
ncbi:MAG: CPBP family intramembrane glutamic endopeptidase [Alphaproteobacteria bacterium]